MYQRKEERNVSAILKDVVPEDLLKFGLTPEFIGRLPVMVTLDQLDRDALIQIWQSLKCINKTIWKILSLDGVELTFTEDALEEIADEALQLKTGARGFACYHWKGDETRYVWSSFHAGSNNA